MAKRFYGLLDNRLEENRQFCEEIEIGNGINLAGATFTEYYKMHITRKGIVK